MTTEYYTPARRRGSLSGFGGGVVVMMMIKWRWW